jgi:hypothetical protein
MITPRVVVFALFEFRGRRNNFPVDYIELRKPEAQTINRVC